ncbi:hypothetical protein GCM10010357_41300 [Streptomyces luteireticuli]|uniref:Uncharacterized protein n=1 Tax=Streptomyces luteireticuli TaxID=173858 RepID=A0ABN0YWU0_9ACTN
MNISISRRNAIEPSPTPAPTRRANAPSVQGASRRTARIGEPSPGKDMDMGSPAVAVGPVGGAALMGAPFLRPNL